MLISRINQFADKTRWLALVLLAFCFVFAFPLPVVGNSAYLAIVLSFAFLLVSQTAMNCFTSLIKNKFVISSLVIFLFLLLFSLFVTTLHNQYDFTIGRTLTNNFLSTFGCVALVSLIFTYAGKRNIIDLMVHVLFIQTFLILIMLLSPEVRELIQSFIRTDSQLERMATYNNVRGLGVSGSVAFGLAITMGFLGFLLHYWFAFYNKNSNSLYTFIIFVLCLLAALSAGRTAVLGFAVGFVFYLFSMNFSGLLRSSFKQVVIFGFIVSSVTVYVLNNEFLMEVAFLYSRYVFRFVWNYLETGSFAVNSLTALDNMYFIPPLQEVLIGSGQYINFDGTHYMHTDAGYMRFMLFFGGTPSLLIYVIYIFMNFWAYENVKSVMPRSALFYSMFIFISFVFHYKGEVIFFSVAFMKIFYLVTFYYLLCNKLNTTNQAVEWKGFTF
ncbi:hypothetical protein [Shewanella psychrotolerans]|uniref:hypothetical protein n=1 Tax=Shewanella psychrotolerans TaxID=2864206 RepID=UPI001C661179|nr:hypothetical protein [Shewanella psychrotolerans]QYK00274.1 hypothetical protein K0I62_12735 [Shewanella psychrotolerans]